MGIRPTCDNSPAVDGPGESLNIVGLTRHLVGNIISAALSSPDEFVDRLADMGANVLILVGRALATVPCRIEHSLAKG